MKVYIKISRLEKTYKIAFDHVFPLCDENVIEKSKIKILRQEAECTK